ncbi:MAG: 3-keto-disaccharide hydrolase [Pirellulaceae bacterium]
MRCCHVVLVVGILGVLAASELCGGENELTVQEKEQGWRLLFNGRDHAGWKCNNGEAVAAPIEDHALVPFQAGSYLIVYEKPFADFVLKCDVKWVDAECNSGVFFRVENIEDPVNTGFEVQVASGAGVSKHSFGAIYDLVPPSKPMGRPAGEWNQLEIRCQGAQISVQLNGQDVAHMNCDQFDQPGVCPDGEKHKYTLNGQPRAIQDFARTGYIGLQDHGHKVWYRNLKLRELP